MGLDGFNCAHDAAPARCSVQVGVRVAVDRRGPAARALTTFLDSFDAWIPAMLELERTRSGRDRLATLVTYMFRVISRLHLEPLRAKLRTLAWIIHGGHGLVESWPTGCRSSLVGSGAHGQRARTTATT